MLGNAVNSANLIFMISYRSALIWSAITIVVGMTVFVATIKSRSAEGVVVVSGGETIVARDINIRELKESGSVEAAQKLYYYYKFAEEDHKKASKWHEEWYRRLAAQRGEGADPK
jgi:hypothetical protein